ncbi:MAG: nucleotidyl transferase AbiEii/AbiGii toxin family protein [Planctomycetota bacterium]|jgi:hypothetical protein
MNSVAALPVEQRIEIFSETAARMGINPAIIEKDFWVCWTLCRLFASDNISKKILFKGGTSLSKVYHLIERFSEDIDLILSWSEITTEDPLGERSGKKQKKLNEELKQKGHQYIHDTLLPEVNEAIGDLCTTELPDDSPGVISIRYPASFSEDYLRPQIRLEIGPRALWCPNATHTITSYAAEAFPDLFETPQCQVNVVTAERTFWEKATILHHEAHRPADSIQPERYSRHYYDMARMSQSAVKDSALQQIELLGSVVHFKKLFFPRGWARYDLAVPGTFRLVPPDFRLTELEHDYEAMRIMIFGQVLDFTETIDQLSQLEQQINQQTNDI